MKKHKSKSCKSKDWDVITFLNLKCKKYIDTKKEIQNRSEIWQEKSSTLELIRWMKVKITYTNFIYQIGNFSFLRMILCGGGAKNEYFFKLLVGMCIGVTPL